ncbi:MAG: tetratricopeptide repeat protein [Albidovulum sp.]|nr:tetratricopeptide repeat protein [Albidovulum sp.]MDE0533003.1 tetratricopeptide repeat protein [Albidovulum sp.]
MLLNKNQNDAAGPEDSVVEGSETNFASEVVESSKERPTIVYFTASWCGPCKQLGPAIEDAVRSTAGKVRLVRYDVDANKRLAAQMRIQSIPAVFAFVDGQPVDGFMGAQTNSEINRFVGELAAKAGGSLESDLERAESLLDQGAAVEAAQEFASIVAEYPDNAQAYSGLIRAHLAFGDESKAQMFLDGAPEEIAGSKEIESVRASLVLARQANEAGPLRDLKRRVDESPEDKQSKFDLAVALHASGDIEGALDELIDLFKIDREWNGGAAKEQLFRIFDSLKPNDPVALKSRRKLSSIIYS